MQVAAQISANVSANDSAADRYARCVEVSRRVRWDIDEDVIRGRAFDYSHKFLPDGLSLVHELDFLHAGEQRFLSQIQGRTYANIFGLVERFINAKVLELSQRHWLGDQVALEALIRFSDEELKHQELFRRIERMVAEGMPEGYTLVADPNDVARVVLGKSTWAVLGLTCHIELFTQQHYKQSIKPCEDLSDPVQGRVPVPLAGGIAARHPRRDRMAGRGRAPDRPGARRGRQRSDRAGGGRGRHPEGAVRSGRRLLPGSHANRGFTADEEACIRDGLLKAYRWQYIVSGVQDPRFSGILGELVTEAQMARITSALAPLM
jgi:hypothetical protein